MGQILLITDDPGRSADLAGGLDPGQAYRVHDLYDEAVPDEAAAVLVTDVPDLGTANVARRRQILARARRGAPLVVVLRQDTPQTRLQALALGASRTVRAPFDLSLLRNALSAPDAPAGPLPSGARRRAEAARAFYGTLFLPDQPVTPVVIDNVLRSEEGRLAGQQVSVREHALAA